MKGRLRRGKWLEGWEEDRKEFFEKRGWTLEEMEVMREVGGIRGEDLVNRERKVQEKERWERIGESGYNRRYGRVKGEGLPGYLKKGWGESRWRRVTRYRLGMK